MNAEFSNEAYLAGTLLIDGDNVIPRIRGIVSRNDFLDETYGEIFYAASTLADRNDPIDPVSIRQIARHDGVELSNNLILQLMECTPTVEYCAEYARRVAEDAQIRRIKELASRIQDDSNSSPDELLTAFQRELQVIQDGNYQRGLLAPADTLRRFSKHVVEAGEGHTNFVSSGFHRLDQILGGGFIRGGLYIIGARPAVGKSTFAINLADNINGNCLFVSLEMTQEQITSKRVSRCTGISSAKLLSGMVNEKDWESIAEANSTLYENGVFYNNSPNLSVQQIQMLAQNVPELQAVIIDYLGLIQASNRKSQIYERVSQISRDLKCMAISLNVPVICLCQLSRTVETRLDKRPLMSDLRDSGSIEQDADSVIFLYRPDYYTGGPADGQPSFVQLDVAKNRHGRTGQCEYSFFMQTSTFLEVP